MGNPGFFKFLKDRRYGERPVEPKAIPERRRDHAGRRIHPRRPIPFGVGAPAGRMICGDGSAVHVQLWDVSEGGLCVVSSSPFDDAPGTLMTLHLQSGVGIETASVEGFLVWVGHDKRFGQFAGLRFPSGHTLPDGSFLDRYLKIQPSR